MTSDRGTSGGAELELNNSPVTPKSPALNPNATVFLSVKSLTPDTAGSTDTGQWEHNDSGIANTTSSVSDSSFVNGDISVDKTDVFSTDSSFQQEYNTFSDNINDINANISAMKLDTTVGTNVILDNTGDGSTTITSMTGGGYNVEPTSYTSDITTLQYPCENGTLTDGEVTDCSLPDTQLRSVLKNQLESYFSRENLSNDSYLMSQMDADQYVPITTVANLDQIQRLTTDIQLIVELLRESTFVQVDDKGEKVRPNHNRCIVILREIPQSTPVQDVQNLFMGANCPKFVSCEFAHNSNWYVTFDSDADAQRAYQYLREEVRTFLGNPIMARIKAKPLIRTYQPRNGYINKRYQQPQVQPQQIPQPAEVVTSSAPQPQYTPTLPFTLTPNVSQYLNGQQAIPFYPPPTNQLLQTWQGPTMLDPSRVLAMNGYQATNVKVNSQTTNNTRNMFNSVNRNNNYTRNQKPGGGQQMGRDRINSNDSLPPRLQHQQQERQMNAANSNMHKTSQSISNHAPVYQGRRGDGGMGPGHGNHGNPSHSINHGNHSHSAPMSHPHHHHHHHQGPTQHHQGHHLGGHQHIDGNNNSNGNSNGAVLNNRQQHVPELSQRYASNKSYKGRRRREDDGARLNRSNSSQSSQGREGPMVGPQRPASTDKFDYEPTSFPPLPGSAKNAASGEVFENTSKLSDVVKGVAKPLVKEITKPVSTISAVSTATTTITTSIPSSVVSSSKDNVVLETTESVNSSNQLLHTTTTTTTSSKMSAAVQPPCVSQSNRMSSRPPVQSVPDTRSTPISDNNTQQQQQQQQQSSILTEDYTASLSANSVKLSYAQMVQKTKVAEVSANVNTDRSDESETEDAETSQPLNRALKEQGQHPAQSSGSKSGARGTNKDFSRKDNREMDSETRREDFRKENDFRRDEPREQRMNRRAKENRERRFERDSGRRGDRRDRDGPAPLRERDGPRTAAAVSK